MDTDQLIKTLAADNAHRARPVGFALMLALVAAAPVSLLMFFTELGIRPRQMQADGNGRDRERQRHREFQVEERIAPVSYTHLTLPTNREV